MIGIYGALHNQWNKRNEMHRAVSVSGIHPLLRTLHAMLTLPDRSTGVENEEFADFGDFELKNFNYPV
jgi:hypothetical protein